MDRETDREKTDETQIETHERQRGRETKRRKNMELKKIEHLPL